MICKKKTNMFQEKMLHFWHCYDFISVLSSIVLGFFFRVYSWRYFLQDKKSSHSPFFKIVFSVILSKVRWFLLKFSNCVNIFSSIIPFKNKLKWYPFEVLLVSFTVFVHAPFGYVSSCCFSVWTNIYILDIQTTATCRIPNVYGSASYCYAYTKIHIHIGSVLSSYKSVFPVPLKATNLKYTQNTSN